MTIKTLSHETAIDKCGELAALVTQHTDGGCVAKTGADLVQIAFILTDSASDTRSMNPKHSFKWRHFQSDIILLCIRWYLRYPLSYRNLEEMMLERGMTVDHTTVYRWVQAYAPELDKRSLSTLETNQ